MKDRKLENYNCYISKYKKEKLKILTYKANEKKFIALCINYAIICEGNTEKGASDLLDSILEDFMSTSTPEARVDVLQSVKESMQEYNDLFIELVVSSTLFFISSLLLQTKSFKEFVKKYNEEQKRKAGNNLSGWLKARFSIVPAVALFCFLSLSLSALPKEDSIKGEYSRSSSFKQHVVSRKIND